MRAPVYHVSHAGIIEREIQRVPNTLCHIGEKQGSVKTQFRCESRRTVFDGATIGSRPLGWKEVGKSGTKVECLAYVKKAWTDMRSLSLRKKGTGQEE